MFKTLLAGTVVFGMALSASAQPPTPTQSPTPTPAKADKTTDHAATADHTFVTKAAEGGMAEVKLGQLAADKATSDDVKKFGQRMVTDHSKANDELKQWAQQKNVTLPTELGAKHKATRDRLATLSGEQFDKAYMQDMLTDHTHDVAAFKRESTTGKDADLKAWAGKTLPTLQEHLTMAQDTATKVGAGAAKKTAAKTPKKH